MLAARYVFPQLSQLVILTLLEALQFDHDVFPSHKAGDHTRTLKGPAAEF